MKEYVAHVQFITIEVRVFAHDKVEAKKRIRAKVAKKNAARLIDKNHLFVEYAQ